MSQVSVPDSLISVESEYVPGVCNIGPAEIQRRKQSAIIAAIGFFISVVAVFILTPIFDWPLWVRGLLFFPAIAMMVSYYQVSNKFCVAFGMMSIQNFSDLGNHKKVRDDVSRKEDLRKVYTMFFNAIIVSLVITMILFAIPI